MMANSTSKFTHLPVLCAETIAQVVTDPAGIYVDATFGRGGATRALLKQLKPSASVWCIDKDAAAITAAHELGDPRLVIRHGSFTQLDGWLQEAGIEAVDGIMMDLGVSSPQLDDASRGFSFLRDGPLDMRMDQNAPVTAADLLNSLKYEKLREILIKYGEVKFPGKIARAIIAARETVPFTSTKQLAELVARVVPTVNKHKHPATQVFQALRIEVNQELTELEQALPLFFARLRLGGRLAVITFHSLEDRIVKSFIRTQQHCELPEWVPVSAEDCQAHLKIIAKNSASDEEIQKNPRARSAKLWVIEKLL